ncbi:PrsW family intramembrane metalloprotease [Amycolatopsis sp. NPDC059027]|uniref:PrsW family intramembrane metalloprotease n=1 Tax=Amycolatopsis sp. NPDC059027 TaxID=3346709 RepID=UPI003671B694
MNQLAYPATGYQPVAAAPRDTRMRAVLLVAVALSALYTAQVVIDMLRPASLGEEAHALVGWLNPPLSGSPYPSFGWYKVSFWCYVVSLPVAAVICLVGRQRGQTLPDPAVRARWTWRWQASAAIVLLLPYPVWLLDMTAGGLGALLICLPSTGYALWGVHRMQRFGRLPVWLLLAVAGWGAVVGGGFGGSMNQWWLDYANSFFSPTMADITANPLGALAQAKHDVATGNWVSAGVFEEIGKGTGVAIVYFLLRDRIDNVVSGIVLGAASGLGFNLLETAQYMSSHNGASASTQYFLRQSLGLMAAHTAFTAAIGAGFGIARQLRDRRARVRAIGCGFAVAISGHFANDVFIAYVSRHKAEWFAPSSTVDMLVLTPLTFLLLQGPMVVLYLLLLRRGLKDQAAGLAVELRAEAATGAGAITAGEVPVLLRPPRRFYLRLKALRTNGFTGYQNLGRLYAAQLRLGMARWHRARGETDPSAPAEQTLRDEVLRLKHRHYATVPYRVAS